MQALHAERITAHVSRVGAARRTQYVLVGIDARGRADAVGALVLHAEPPPRRVSRRGPAGAARRRAVSRDRLRGRGWAPSSSSTISTLSASPARSRRRRGRWVVTVRSGAGVGAALSSIGAQAGRLAFEVGPGDPRGPQRREPPPQRRDRQPAPDGRGGGSSARVDRRRSRPTRRAGRRCRPRCARPPSSGARHPDDDLAQLAELAGCSRPAMAGRLHRLVAAAGEGGDRVEVRCPHGAESTVTGGCPAWE